MKELVSVIMTVYNAEKYLEKTILSIRKQTYKEIEFIIVNDASTDRSLEVIMKHKKLDNRIILINQGKLGRGKALNKALKEARGKYIANIDSDDPSYERRLEIQKKYLDKNLDIVLIGTDSDIINDKDEKIGELKNPKKNEEIKKSMVKQCPFNHSSVMYRRKEILELGGYDETLPGQLDYELWIRILKRYYVENLSDTLSTKRIHDNQYFEGNILRKKYFYLLKNEIKAIEELKLPRYNYIFILKGMIKTFIPRKFKLYLKKVRLKCII